MEVERDTPRAPSMTACGPVQQVSARALGPQTESRRRRGSVSQERNWPGDGAMTRRGFHSLLKESDVLRALTSWPLIYLYIYIYIKEIQPGPDTVL